MEAMASGLPCVVSDIRGNTDLIESGTNGILCNVNSIGDYVNSIDMLIQNESIREEMKEYNRLEIKKFDIHIVMEQMKNIFEEIIENV